MPVEVEDTIRALDHLVDRMGRASLAIAAQGARMVNVGARALAPIGLELPHRTGTPGDLARSIRTTGPVPSGRGAYTAHVGPTVIYGRQRELGGPIAPVFARRLRWWAMDGTPIFARHVVQFPHPYLKPAAEAVRHRYRDLAIRRWGDAIRRA